MREAVVIGVKPVPYLPHEAEVNVPEISVHVSLGVIVAVLGVTTATSVIAARGQVRAAEEPDKPREYA